MTIGFVVECTEAPAESRSLLGADLRRSFELDCQHQFAPLSRILSGTFSMITGRNTQYGEDSFPPVVIAPPFTARVAPGGRTACSGVAHTYADTPRNVLSIAGGNTNPLRHGLERIYLHRCLEIPDTKDLITPLNAVVSNPNNSG